VVLVKKIPYISLHKCIIAYLRQKVASVLFTSVLQSRSFLANQQNFRNIIVSQQFALCVFPHTFRTVWRNSSTTIIENK